MPSAAELVGRDVHAHRLEPSLCARIVEVLGAMVTEQRRARLEQALDHRTREVVVAIEDVANEHNAAAVLRSAEAFGFFETHIIESETRFHVSRQVASGAHKWLDLRRHDSTEKAYAELRGRGYQIWASVLRGDSVPVHDIPVDRKVALVFGNEHRGLSAGAIDRADGRFMIPMLGLVESLNISVAVATSCYDLLSRRRIEHRPNGLAREDRDAVLAAWLARSVKSSREVLEREGLPVPVLLEAPIPLTDSDRNEAGRVS